MTKGNYLFYSYDELDDDELDDDELDDDDLDDDDLDDDDLDDDDLDVANNIIGTEGDDIITPDLVSIGVVGFPDSVPGAGADTIQGLGGADTIDGGGGDDSIIGGAGADILTGGAGADTLTIGTGDTETGEIYDGGDDIDVLSVTGNGDISDSTTQNIEIWNVAAGGDLTISETNLNAVTEIQGAGTIRGAVGGNFTSDDLVGITVDPNLTIIFDEPFVGTDIIGTEGDDIITPDLVSSGVVGFPDSVPGAGADTIQGLGGADIIDGGGGDDSIFGGAGSDSLLGSGGNDTIDGGAGVDSLLGGDGNDILSGGAARDLFVFTNEGIDTIDDFTPGAGGDVFALVSSTYPGAPAAGTPVSTSDVAGITADTNIIIDTFDQIVTVNDPTIVFGFELNDDELLYSATGNWLTDRATIVNTNDINAGQLVGGDATTANFAFV